MDISELPSKTIRVFIGIFFDEDILKALHQAMVPLKSHFDPKQIRWEALDKLHLTLRFLGNISVELLPDIEQELLLLAQTIKPFIINLQKIEFFPSLKEPRLIAVLTDYSAEFKFFIEELEKRLASLHFAKEPRPFKGHMTLGRFQKRLHPSSPLNVPIDIQTKIGNFSLMQSRTLTQSSQYLTLRRFVLI